MEEKEFYNFVEETKSIVLAAVRKYLSGNYYCYIDDVVQETYLRAYRAIEKNGLKMDKSLNNWLYTIAKNESIRMVEKLKREEAKVLKAQESFTKKHRRNKFDEEIIEMKNIISGLPEKYKTIFELLVYGYSESQIAEKLDIRQGTVKSRIHRGRELISRTSKMMGLNYEYQ
ncbi:MAG: RNA polymerase sigma factor [Spirochaetes bacterium]|nr:RNA polymerase sigma factor [Spirochaetota bacterium]